MTSLPRLGRSLAGALLALGAGGLAPAAAHAQTTYTFTIPLTQGPTTGTLTGSLVLPFLTPGGTGSGAASVVTLTGIPAGFPPLPQGNVATTWTTQLLNFFDVVGGNVIGFRFAALTGPGDLGDYELCFNNGPTAQIGDRYCPTDLNFLGQGAAANYGYNQAGAAGITFTPVTSAVPEPATLALVATGGLLLGAVAHRRRRA